MLRGNFPDHKKMKQDEAKQRQEQANKLSPSQRLEKLDQGGYVAFKERKKIENLMENTNK